MQDENRARMHPNSIGCGEVWALAILNKIDERNLCWREADKIIPGFTSKRSGEMLEGVNEALDDIAKQRGKTVAGE
jgi:hypothetical protein